jgi:outer membrane protein assembly factor BamB
MFKKFIIVISLSALLLTACTSQSTKSAANHLAKTPVSSPTATTVPGTLKWTYQIGDPSIHQQEIAFTNPVVANGLVYVAGPDGTHAINIADGSQKWFSSAGLFGCTITNGVAFLTNGVNDIYALNANDGSQKWVFHGKDNNTSQCIYWNGTLFTETGLHIEAINVTNGVSKWSYPTQGYINFQMANGVIYGRFIPYGTNTIHVFAIDAATGAQKWEKLLSLDRYCEPIAYVGADTMYLGLIGNLIALNVTDGTQKWTFSGSSGEYVVPHTEISSLALITSSKNTYALNASNGQQIWSKEGNFRDSNGVTYVETTSDWQAINTKDGSLGQVIHKPSSLTSIQEVTITNDYAYYFENGTVRTIGAFNTKDGTIRWSHPIKEILVGPPQLVDGVVYAMENEGTLYAFTA